VFTAGAAGVAAFAATFAVGLLLPAVVYGWSGNLEQLAGWYRTVTDTTAPNLLAPENVSAATMWAKWLGPGPTASMLATATVAIVLVLAASAWLWRGRVRQPAYLEFGVLMLLVPLISPQGWDYVLLLATPAVLCLVDRFREMGRPWQIVTAAAFAFMSFTIYDVLGRAIYARMMALSVVSVAAIVLVGCLIAVRRRTLA